jgi:hypothetical protein
VRLRRACVCDAKLFQEPPALKLLMIMQESFVQGQTAMPEQADNMIVRNLVEAISRLHDDLERVELWTAALGSFQSPIPGYEPSDQHLLPTRPKHRSR